MKKWKVVNFSQGKLDRIVVSGGLRIALKRQKSSILMCSSHPQADNASCDMMPDLCWTATHCYKQDIWSTAKHIKSSGMANDRDSF